MGIENNEEDPNRSLLGIPPGHPVDPAAAAKRKADWEAAKERAVQSKPSTLGRTDRFARHSGLKDQRAGAKARVQAQEVNAAATAGQESGAITTAQPSDAAVPAPTVRKARTTRAKDSAPDAVDGAQQIGTVAKPPRNIRATPKAAKAGAQEQPAGAEVAKAPRSRRKAATAQEQAQPVNGTAPAVDRPDIPKITPEAITFLSRPDATAADLFKLQPESQAFVQYHITNMQRLEVESELNNSHLMSTAPKYSKNFEKVVDALLAKLAKDRRAGIKPSAEVPKPAAAMVAGVSYRPRWAQMGAYQITPVHLRTIQIGPGKSESQEQETPAALAAVDIQRAHKIMGTTHGMVSSQIGEVTRQQAADLVAGDIEDVRVIKDERARRLALNAMLESSHAQPHYKEAFERLAPELVASAKEASAAVEADRVREASQSVRNAAEQTAENTIERGSAPDLKNQPTKDSQQPAPAAASLGRRMLSAMGAWLQGKAEEEPASAATSGAKTVSLDKQPAQAAQAPADEKANLVPDTVAQRFLRVERDYYFLDKTLAFSDRGNKLATRGAHPEVVRSLIEVAQARGWDSITVKGTDEFRRSAWMEATQAGLKVAGYKPSALDLAELARKPATNTVENGIAKEREIAAPQSPAQPPKAPQASKAEASKAAASAPSPELAAKARAFEKEKPGFVVKKFPELAQAYGVVDAAKKFAEAKLPGEVRDEFVSLARRHVMQKILNGEHAKGPQIYAVPAKSKAPAKQVQASAQPAVDPGKAERSKEIPRER
jgi:hypothetical protein